MVSACSTERVKLVRTIDNGIIRKSKPTRRTLEGAVVSVAEGKASRTRR